MHAPHAFRFEQIEMRGYARYTHATLTLRPGINVLANAREGAAMIRAAAMALSLMRWPTGPGRSFLDRGSDATGSAACAVRWRADIGTANALEWASRLGQGSNRRRHRREALLDAVDERILAPGERWPVLAHYGPGWPHPEPHGHPHEAWRRDAGYEGAMTPDNGLGALTEWIGNEWMGDIARADNAQPERGLWREACAIAAIGTTGAWIPNARDQAITITTRDTHSQATRPLNTLAPRARRTSALLADIARHTLTLNAGLGTSACSPGVVLIEALEAPPGAGGIEGTIRTFAERFPKLQWLVTTRAPGALRADHPWRIGPEER